MASQHDGVDRRDVGGLPLSYPAGFGFFSLAVIALAMLFGLSG
jgi:hypothetical protein